MIPRLLDWQYSPEDRLGGGGYAQAYLARNPAHADGSCVIKAYDNPFYANTFEGEVRALQTLDGCPGTSELVAHGRNREGRLCIVTRHLPGLRLDRRISLQGPLTHGQSLSLVEQMLKILRVAHEKGLLHKDIKASNVIMDGERFALLDWGVAEFVGNGRSENIRAKQDCVAPECYRGEHGPATDFYALGWLAVHALTGALPYHFKEVADPDYRVAAHCLERPVLSPEIPEPLQCLIANWLAKNPAQRLVGYSLPSLLDRAKINMPNFWDYMEIRQIQRECGYLHLAARHGAPYAQYHRALRLHKAGRVKEAIHWLELAAASGYALAAERLARVLLQEDDVGHKDRAEKLLRMAAKAGNPNALFRLGRAMVRKRGNVRKIEQGMSFLATAAAGGHASSQYELAVRLANAPDRAQEAAAYLSMAADRGHAKAPPYWQEPTVQGGSVSNVQQPEGSAAVRIVQADQLSDLDEHARAWDALLLQCPRAYPMQSHGWVRAFFEHKLQPRQRLLCLFAYQGQRLVGVMPLAGGCSAPGLGFTEHCFMAPYNAYHIVRGDCLILPGQEDVFGVMIEHLMAICQGPPVLRFRRVAKTSPIFQFFRQPREHLCLLHRVDGGEKFIRPVPDYPTYLAGLDGKFRRELGRQTRRLQEQSVASYRLRDRGGAGENLEAFMAVEDSGWKGQKKTSIRAVPGDAAVFLDATRRMQELGWMEWNFLEADRQIIAAQYAMRVNRIVYLLKVGYREEFANCAPGQLLLAKTIENASLQGDVDEINFLARRTWLRVWNVAQRNLYTLIVAPRDPFCEPLFIAAVEDGYSLDGYGDFV